ncbi:SDR family NAD(P)-dependent oxidoreductase [Streptomyces bacillaris]|uniref:SDR family NAD(P)-dependent oxidoreductase n=1 Tax=unclassified Streptomyces TaxID=2593676 RepID=UPI00036CC497|nr:MULTISPECIES: SDR family NAD(P)-dependent oxidoreductase [unclassified Streptomyces]MYT35614.1 SDR family oxidoreductase [Streptomyces sp. SID8356]PWS41963.1 SDR family NAD(P)-dependent oxidoreductase [Streptomyces sp. ZEA17I]
MTSGFAPTLLEGRTTFLTGASSGIGAVLATMLAAHGSRVALMARSEKELRLLAERIEADGGRAVAVPGDLTDAESVRASVREAEELLGPIDRLVHCAGEARNQAFLCDQDEDQWMATLDINLLGAFRVARAVVPGMMERREGNIVMVSSIAGKRGLPANTSYCASKFGLNGMTQALASELGAFGVRVNAVCPGLTDSPAATDGERYGDPFMAAIAKHHGPPDLTWERYLKRAVNSTILRRLVRPEEIAAQVLFLLSDLSGGMTGQAVNVDAGAL